jgi:hypothetical protein
MIHGRRCCSRDRQRTGDDAWEWPSGRSVIAPAILPPGTYRIRSSEDQGRRGSGHRSSFFSSSVRSTGTTAMPESSHTARDQAIRDDGRIRSHPWERPSTFPAWLHRSSRRLNPHSNRPIGRARFSGASAAALPRHEGALCDPRTPSACLREALGPRREFLVPESLGNALPILSAVLAFRERRRRTLRSRLENTSASAPRVTDKGFIRFAAEKARRRKRRLGAANVMKPCSELNLGATVDLEWVLFGFGGCGLGLRKAVGWYGGVAEGMGR